MKKLPWIMVVMLSVALMFSINKNMQLTNSYNTYTDTIAIYDTTFYSLPVPRDSIVVRYKYITIPVLQDSTKNEIKVVETSKDSTTLSIPITQRKYQTNEFTAWVSGYQPQLDSCHIYPKTTTITKTQIVKESQWGLGVHVGMGVCGNQIAPYFGLGISYNLFSW